MNAVVEIQGVQFRVSTGDKIRVPRISNEPGTKVSLDKVLFLDEGSDIKIGKPHVSGAVVESTVQEHGLGKKVVVFKMKRRKDYRVKTGHRQPYTLLYIDNIVLSEKSRKSKTTRQKPQSDSEPTESKE